MNINWEPLRQIIQAHERFVISSHVRPDADAIGSEIGLAYILQSLGKTVQIVNTSATPANLYFLDPARQAQQLGAVAKPASGRLHHFAFQIIALGADRKRRHG